MKRTLKYALTATFAAALVIPAVAQDTFPDVPANHWAYEALAKLKKEGLLVGYPDGLYRGSRAATRYELAVAIHAVYTNLKTVTDGLQTQIDALKNATPTTTGEKVDLTDIRNAISALQSDVNTVKAYGDNIASLKKLADTFEKELRSLGVDVEALKKDLSDIADRVAKLEKRKPTVDISGDFNIAVLAGNSRDDRLGLDKDGHVNGFSAAGPVGLTKDATILHEGAFTFKGTNETGPTWKATLVVGNLFPTYGGTSTFTGGPYVEASTDTYFSEFSAKFNTSIAGLGFDVEAGRVGYKINPWILSRPKTSSYLVTDRIADGKYTFDGAILGFNFGSAKLDVIAGKNSKRLSQSGIDINPMVVSNMRVPGFDSTNSIDRSLGLNLNVPLTSAGNLNLAYLWLDSDATTLTVPSSIKTGNRIAVFGGDADFSFGKIKVTGGYHKSNLQNNNSNVIDDDNSAWNAGLSYAGSNWNLGASYAEIEANYVAPGDWDRVAVIRNPANVKGFIVNGDLAISSNLKLTAGGQFWKGKSDTVGGLFTTDSKINSFNVGLNYALSSSLGLSLSYEDAKLEDLTGVTGDPHFKWTTLALNYGLGANAKLNFGYEVSDHTDLGGLGFTSNSGKYTGGLFTTQLTIKF